MPLKTQTNVYACQLCSDDETRFQVEGTDVPRGPLIDQLFQHLLEAHSVPVEESKRAKGGATMFLDGQNGYAAQHYLYKLADGRPVIAHAWSQENVGRKKKVAP